MIDTKTNKADNVLFVSELNTQEKVQRFFKQPSGFVDFGLVYFYMFFYSYIEYYTLE